MILKSFRVTEFRSVKDSGWIDAESITALIGTNESGKTNILLPLWKLNPADEGKIDLKTDLPRDKYHLYRSASPKPIFIQAKYILSEQEMHDLSTLSGRDCHEFSEIIISKDFDNTLHYEFPFSVDQEPSIVENGKKVLTDCLETLESGTDTSNRAETERRDNAIQIVQSCLHTLETNATFDGLKAVNDELGKFPIDVRMQNFHYPLHQNYLPTYNDYHSHKQLWLLHFVFYKVIVVYPLHSGSDFLSA